MKTKLYLDTSIPSAFFDTSKPMRQLITQKWFEHEAAGYELFISALTIEEVERLRSPEKLLNIRNLLASAKLNVLNIPKKRLHSVKSTFTVEPFQHPSPKTPITSPLQR